MDLITIIKELNTQEKCLNYLEQVRWAGQPVCPYCGSIIYSRKDHRYTCRNCNNSYSVTVGTVFEDSNLLLTKWFLGISLMLSAKKGISSRQLSRHLSVNKDTAWLLQKKIRLAMAENKGELRGLIETDESFIGGKSPNRHLEKRQIHQGKGTGYADKTPVLGMLERKGKIITRVLKKASGKEIIPIMTKWINPKSTIITDGFGGYYYCSDHFESHQVINHNKGNYRYGEFHMNTLEGFWSMFKRSLVGQFHQVSAFYLQHYLDEMAFKYNHRKIKDKGFELLLKRLINL